MNYKHLIRLSFILLLSINGRHVQAQQFALEEVGIIDNEFGPHFPFTLWGDFDNDRDLDLIRLGVGYESRMNRNNGQSFDNTMQLFSSVPETNNSFFGSICADIDRDGYLDILYTSSNGNCLFKNSFGNSFQKYNNLFDKVSYGNLDAADIDQDGDLDLVISGASWNGINSDNGPRIYRNDGNLTFTQIYQGQLPNVCSDFFGLSIRFADFTKDGLPDIILSGSFKDGPNVGQNRTQIYRNTGSGFSLLYTMPNPLNTPRMDVGDYNADGWIDFVITGKTETGMGLGYVYKNNGDNTFSLTSTLDGFYGSVAFGDYDNDGDLDISLFGGGSNGFSNQIYNNGGIGFFNNNILQNPVSNYAGGTAAWVDYDNDKKLDLFCMGKLSYSIETSVSAMMRNQNALFNSEPFAPSGLNAVVTGQDVLLSWSAGSDGTTPTAGLSYNIMVGTGSNDIDIVSPHSDPMTGYLKTPRQGNAWNNLSYKLKNLAPGKYYWKVQSVDGAFTGSNFSNEQSFTIPPPAPTVTSPVSYCINSTAFPLSATPMTGGTLYWYTSATGGFPSVNAPTPSTTTVGTTTYYVSQYINSVEGPRTPIDVIVRALPAGPAVSPASFCKDVLATPLFATPEIGGSVYWYGVNATGGNSSSTAPIPSTSVAGTFTYYVTQKLNGCESNPRTALVVTVHNPPAITAQPGASAICPGDGTTFSVSATGLNLTYQWEESTDGGGIYTPITNGGIYSNATTPVLKLSNVTTAHNGIYYRCNVKSTCEPAAVTNDTKLTVYTPVSFLTQPASVAICPFSNTTFTVTAAGTGLSYQWQFSTDGVSYTNLTNGGGYSNVTTAALTLSNAPASLNGYRYRCKVTGTCGTAFSADAILNFNSTPVLTKQPSPTSTCAGSTALFSITASGGTLTYQWQESTDGVSYTTIINGGFYNNVTTPTLTLNGPSALMNGYYYRCNVSNSCTSVASNGVVLSVTPSASISTQPASQTKCEGSNTNFTVAATGPQLSYQWQMSTNGTTYSNISDDGTYLNTTSPSLLLIGTPSSLDGRYFRCMVSGSCGSGTSSNGAKLTVSSQPTVNTQPVNTTVCNGTNALFNVTASGEAINYQWQVSTNGGSSYSNIINDLLYSNVNTSSLTIKNAGSTENNNYYRCVISGTCSPVAISNGVRLIVNPVPTVTSILSGTACSGTAQNYVITGTPANTSFTWSRAAVTGISNTSVSNQAGTLITETLVNTTSNSIDVSYVILPTANGCTGTGSNYVVTVGTIPSMPSVSNKSYCHGITASPLNAIPASNGILKWYSVATGGTGVLKAPVPSTSIVGTTDYYVSQTMNGCESARNTITVTVETMPTVNAGSDKKIDEGTAVTLTGTGNAASYVWNRGVSDGVAFVPAGSESGYYTVTGTLGNCSKQDSMVLLILRPNLPEIATYHNSVQYFSGSLINSTETTVLRGPYTYTFTINNQGYANLDINDITVSGATAFSINKSMTKNLLKPDSTTTFDLIFQPLDTGNVSATITIQSNDQDEGLYEIYINANPKRIKPDIIFSPISDKDFDSDPFELIASASNGKPVTFVSLTPLLAEINGTTLTTLKQGEAIVEASIQGDHLYEPVTVTQGFTIKLSVFGILGSDYLASNSINSYQIYPNKSKFQYKWYYEGSNINYISDTSGYLIQIAAKNTSNSGLLKCNIYNLNGELLGTIDKTITINPQKSNALSLAEQTCPPSISNVRSSYIREFEMEQLISTSTYNNSGVSDFTQSDRTTDLYLGESYSAKLKIKSSSSANRAIGVWIDFDNDGIFTQQEFIFSDIKADSVIYLTDLRIPNVESNIGYRRLRIKVRETDAFTFSQSCVTETENGETEDYMVNLKARIELHASEFVSANSDGKNDCFIIQGINPKSQIRSISIFDSSGNIVHTDDFYENDWCGVATEGNRKNQLVPRGTYYFIFDTEGTTLKSFFEFTY